MKRFFYNSILGVLVLLVGISGRPLWAQAVQDDSVPVSVVQPSSEEISQLKGRLGRHRNSVQELDTLLNSARRLAYLPGQVVALSYLINIRLQDQQSQQAEALVQEAVQLASRIRDVKETSWAMTQVGRLMRSTAKRQPAVANALVPVLESLGEAMKVSASIAGKQKESESGPVEIFIPGGNRGANKRPRQLNTSDFLSSLPVPTVDPTLGHPFRIKHDFGDRWLDTLIQSGVKNPKIVRQLNERKKLRDSTKALSTAFAKEGDYAQAYRYYLQYTAYKDSLTAEATSRRLASLEYRQNLLKKEAQINLLKKDQQLRDEEAHRQRQYVLLMIGCIVLLVAFSTILTRNNRAKQLVNQQLSEQKEALQETLAQLKTTQSQLIQAEKMASLGELTAGIAHEIQNPLNFVNNFSEVSSELVAELLENRQSAERDDELEQELLTDVQQNLQKINQHGSRASAIVKGMLEHARPSGGQKERTDLNALAEEYFKLAYHGIRAKDKSFEAKLTTALDPGLAPVSLIPQDMGRVLLNVFTNAFYAVQKRQQTHPQDYHPEVSLKTSQDAQQIKITIRDNGIGIPDSIKQKVFQPFFTTKPTGQGTGLGLSLSYDIVTKGHGGTLVLDSKEGQFTELTITLPIPG